MIDPPSQRSPVLRTEKAAATARRLESLGPGWQVPGATAARTAPTRPTTDPYTRTPPPRNPMTPGVQRTSSVKPELSSLPAGSQDIAHRHASDHAAPSVYITVTEEAAGRRPEQRPRCVQFLRGWFPVIIVGVLSAKLWVDQPSLEQPAEGRWDARRLDPSSVHDRMYYVKCAIGGSLACASHAVLTPLDVVKVNMQMDPVKYRGLFQGLSLVAREDGCGISGLWRGAVAMAVAYGMQGICKFGLYEVFKDGLMTNFGYDFSEAHTGFVWVLASAVAETIADVALCPYEMLKVKQQTAPLGTFPMGFCAGARRFWQEREQNGFPFGSLAAVWVRQIPYTIAKFVVFERTVQFFYGSIFMLPKASYPRSIQLFVTLASGFITGVVAASISHVPDSLFSLRAKPENSTRSYAELVKEFGVWRLATSGLFMRMLMMGTLAALQWWVYDAFKAGVGLPTTATLFRK